MITWVSERTSCAETESWRRGFYWAGTPEWSEVPVCSLKYHKQLTFTISASHEMSGCWNDCAHTHTATTKKVSTNLQLSQGWRSSLNFRWSNAPSSAARFLLPSQTGPRNPPAEPTDAPQPEQKGISKKWKKIRVISEYCLIHFRPCYAS